MTPLISTSYQPLNLISGTKWFRDQASKEVQRVRIEAALDSASLATITGLCLRVIDNGSMPVAVLPTHYLFVAAYVVGQVALLVSLGSAIISIKKKGKSENLFLIPKRSDPENAAIIELHRKNALRVYATQTISIAIFTLFFTGDGTTFGTTLGLGIFYQGLRLVSLYNRLGVILDPESWENIRFLKAGPIKGCARTRIFIQNLTPIKENTSV